MKKKINIIYKKNHLVSINDVISRSSDICKTELDRASYAKHLRSKKHLENEKQIKMIIPE